MSPVNVGLCETGGNFILFKGRILLANLLQSSRSTFSWRSFLSFLAFKEGMLSTPISVLGGWPTVSGGFWRHFCRAAPPCLGQGRYTSGGVVRPAFWR